MPTKVLRKKYSIDTQELIDKTNDGSASLFFSDLSTRLLLGGDIDDNGYIKQGAVTAEKVQVDNLSSISQSLGAVTSGRLDSTTGSSFLDLDTDTFRLGTEALPQLLFTNGNLTIAGTLVASEIHIPNENVAANSFHTDSLGNSWWGCTHDNFTSDHDNAVAYILNSGEAKFRDITLTDFVTLAYTNSDNFTINYDGTDIDVDLVLNRTTGGAMHFTWNGVIAQLNRPFLPTELLINNISDTEPATPYAGQVWIDP